MRRQSNHLMAALIYMIAKPATIAFLACAVSTPALAGMMSIVAAPTGYFVPTDAQKGDYPYFRGPDGDWDWQHEALSPGFDKAMLTIRAFDVDTVSGEVDNIYAWDDDTANPGTWTLLGTLVGSTQTWTETEFDLDSALFDDIESGLWVKIDISALPGPSFNVSLGESKLETVPIPGAVLLGVIGMTTSTYVLHRRRKKSIEA